MSKKNSIFAAESCKDENMTPKTIDNIYLYRITHIGNIPHILSNGIVHKSSPSANPNYIAIGDVSLIDYRSNKSVNIDGHNIILGDYIPFYFGVRMPMLLVIQSGWNFVKHICHPQEIIYIVVSLSKIIQSGYTFYFSDGHATNSLTDFYSARNVAQLPALIDWNAVSEKYWSNEDDLDLKRRKQAEFLIKEDVAPHNIVGYVCYNTEAKQQLINMGVNPEIIKIAPQAYY